MDTDTAVQSIKTRHHDSLYLNGGDIVLSARDGSDGRVLFRVDKRILSHHSPVFAGMFTLPCPPGVNEEYDGVPLVSLEDDGDGVAEMLGFMYNSSCVSPNRTILHSLTVWSVALWVASNDATTRPPLEVSSYFR